MMMMIITIAWQFNYDNDSMMILMMILRRVRHQHTSDAAVVTIGLRSNAWGEVTVATATCTTPDEAIAKDKKK